MATRSTIALEHADGSVQQVYCHFDGYIENNGKILQAQYADPDKLSKLIELGDLSSLGMDIGTKHDFEYYGSDICTFYGRDRDEDNVEARRFENYDDYVTNLQAEEYNYILRPVDGQYVWFVSHYESQGNFETLIQSLNRVAVESLK